MVRTVITLVGVGHVFDLKRQVREVIVSRQPRVVGIELDRVRWVALQAQDRRGDAPLVYRLLSFFQERVADQYEGRVGDEMLAAAAAAREVGADLALIDRDSAEVFQDLWGGMSFEERVRLVVAALASVFVTKKRVEKELARFEADNAGYLEEFGAQFPRAKHVLIDERNAHMARLLREIHGSQGRVVAVIGDGHIEGLRHALAGLPVEVIRLGDLRANRIPLAPPAPPDGPSVTFSYDMRGPGAG